MFPIQFWGSDRQMSSAHLCTGRRVPNIFRTTPDSTVIRLVFHADKKPIIALRRGSPRKGGLVGRIVVRAPNSLAPIRHIYLICFVRVKAGWAMIIREHPLKTSRVWMFRLCNRDSRTWEKNRNNSCGWIEFELRRGCVDMATIIIKRFC